MGQSAPKEGPWHCGPRKDGLKPVQTINLLERSLKVCRDQHQGIVDRSDLRKVWEPFLTDFISCNESETDATVTIAISPSGDVNIVGKGGTPKAQKRDTVYQLAFQTDAIKVGGAEASWRIRIQSPEASYDTVRRCKTTEELTEALMDFLFLGVDKIEIVLVRELIELTFDKVQLMEEYESTHKKKDTRKPLVQNLMWGPILECRLEGEEPLKLFFEKLEETGGKVDKAGVVREMRQLGWHHEAIERFYEGSGGPLDSDGNGLKFKTAKYLRDTAATAPTRTFEARRYYSLTKEPKQDVPVALGKELEAWAKGTVSEVMTKMMQEATEACKDINSWKLLLAWDTMSHSTVEEHIHQARRCEMNGNRTGMQLAVSHAVELLGLYAQFFKTSDSSSKSSTTTLPTGLKPPSTEDFEFMFTITKQAVDDIVENYLSGLNSKERFEEQLELNIVRMVKLIDNVLVPMAEQMTFVDVDERMRFQVFRAIGIRSKGDYLRYANIFLPKYRETFAADKNVIEVYEEAKNLSSKLQKPRNMAQLTTYVNYALFYAEIRREPDEAARICEEGLRESRCIKDGVCTLRHQPVPAEIYNFDLLHKNLDAFQSYLLMVLVTFHSDPWAQERSANRHYVEDEEEELLEEAQEEAAAKTRQKQGRNCANLFGTGQDCLVPPSEETNYQKKTGDPKVMAFKAAPRMSHEESKRLAVLQWLSGRPLSRASKVTARRGDQQDNKLRRVLWVEHVDERPEFLQLMGELHRAGKWGPGSGDAGPTSPAAATRPRDPTSPKLVPASRAASRPSQAPIPDNLLSEHTHLVVCVVQTDSGVRDVDESSHGDESSDDDEPARGGTAGTERSPTDFKPQEWQRILELPLLNWPTRGAPPRTILNIGKRSQKMQQRLQEALNERGVVTTNIVVQSDIGDVELHPGDTLLASEMVPHSSIVMRDVPNIELQFVPRLSAHSIEVLAASSYCDFHEHFVGFRGGQRLHFTAATLLPEERHQQESFLLSSFKVLYTEIEKALATKKDYKQCQRRIRGLSARRNPHLASRRGCR